ncbi:MAG: tetratricopeptide repeat protein [Chloroflexota bacterium]
MAEQGFLKISRLGLLLVAVLMLAACQSGGPSLPRPTTAPTLDPAQVAPTLTAMAGSAGPVVTCADLNTHWGQDWPAVLDTLDRLIQTGQSCGEEPLLSKKYAAHFIYATALEEQGQTEEAIAHYQAALTIDPHRREALAALVRVEALPPPTPPTCRSNSPPRPDPAPAAPADPTQFVTVAAGRLQLAGRPFTIRGLNYYPRQAPWERFFTQADPAAMAEELDLIQAAGFNTLRVFLWYEPLFTCQPEEAIPNEEALALVDTLFRLAGERDLKVIVSLNDLPDLIFRPLYTDWPRYDTQTIYLVRRYRNEPGLLAWDVRNGGDLDLENIPGRFTEAQLYDWLAHLTRLIRQHDPHHLITAGWEGDPRPTAPYVDLLAFQHWGPPAELADQLATYHGDKPLLLIAGGEHSWPGDPASPQDEASQAEYLRQIVELAEAEEVGWLLWTAFDFAPVPGQPETYNFHFGLWRTDLSPKLALQVLPLEP